MLKSYKIDGSAGEISNRLEDKMQESSRIPLREISFEELTGFIPKKDFLAETINGVELQYLIKNQPSKSFVLDVNQETVIFHIFEDKIITTFLSLVEVKIFVDAIPTNIKVNVAAISSCFEVVEKSSTKILFNSTAGIYFCTTTKMSPEYIPLGGAYFTKIFIPDALVNQQIISPTRNFLTGNLYYYNGVKDFVGDGYQFLNTSPLGGTLQEYGTGFYAENLNLKIGNTILANDINCFVKDDSIDIKKIFRITFRVKKRLSGIKLKSSSGLDLIYPFTVKPSKIDITKIQAFTNQGVTVRITNKDLLFDNNFSNVVTLFELEPIKIEGSWKDIKGNNIAAAFGTKPELMEKKVYWQNAHVLELYYEFSKSYGLSYATLDGFPFAYLTDLTARSCLPTYNASIVMITSPTETEVQKNSPYTPYSLDGRLAVSSFNVVKMSKVGEYENFTIVENANPLETDPFEVIYQDIGEITFISSWSSGNEKGFVFGTTKELLYFSSLTNIFKKQIIDKKPIPCSYIPPLQFNINNITSNVIVEAGRKKITAIIPTKEQTTNLNLTQYVNFFDNDSIKRIEKISYDQDQMLFVLTDGGQLYGCLTGGSILAWFRIKLTYEIEDITTLDSGFMKKLFLISKLRGSQGQKLVGSINFTENASQTRAEYYTDTTRQFEISPTTNEFTIANTNSFVLKTALSQTQKEQLVKPIVCKMTFHNQEIITSKINTKQNRVKRRLLNAKINVRESNNFKINYIYNDTNKPVFSKTVLDFNKIDDELNITPIKEFIEILNPSPSSDNVRLSVETNTNSTLPLKIQSIIFDTEYGNSK